MLYFSLYFTLLVAHSYVLVLLLLLVLVRLYMCKCVYVCQCTHARSFGCILNNHRAHVERHSLLNSFSEKSSQCFEQHGLFFVLFSKLFPIKLLFQFRFRFLFLFTIQKLNHALRCRSTTLYAHRVQTKFRI